MAVSLTVRSTVVDDHPGLLEVVRAAFSDDTRDGNVEVDIVLDTRALGQPVRPIDLSPATATRSSAMSWVLEERSATAKRLLWHHSPSRPATRDEASAQG